MARARQDAPYEIKQHVPAAAALATHAALRRWPPRSAPAQLRRQGAAELIVQLKAQLHNPGGYAGPAPPETHRRDSQRRLLDAGTVLGAHHPSLLCWLRAWAPEPRSAGAAPRLLCPLHVASRYASRAAYQASMRGSRSGRARVLIGRGRGAFRSAAACWRRWCQPLFQCLKSETRSVGRRVRSQYCTGLREKDPICSENIIISFAMSGEKHEGAEPAASGRSCNTPCGCGRQAAAAAEQQARQQLGDAAAAALAALCSQSNATDLSSLLHYPLCGCG
jgi:hypothetical protein